ncbi:MAG: hypothetical protein DWQ37_23575 [Planctomycetota bacterium]|nr:MAG: hypothetical protein DWQ37_23575 [Planctomycetota bacterium]
MSTVLPRGMLTISVDLDPGSTNSRSADHALLESLLARLLELLGQHDLPATWALADPAVSAARKRIEQAGSHELAILGDASWVGREAGRARFAHELGRRVSRARGDGIELSTLALRTVLPIDHCDLVVKEGLVAARHGSGKPISDAPRRLHPQTLRFGLWGFPISIALPGSSRLLPGGGGTRAARFVIDEAISERGLVHLAVDGPALALRGNSAVRVLQRIVEHAQRRRRHGLLEVVTLGAMAEQLSQLHCGQPSRSILRPAA